MTWIQTHTGIAFDLVNPKASDVSVEDIAHALGGICRYNGHTSRHYSVAQHCVLVAQALERDGHAPEVVLGGLLHDAAEAYVGDMSGPMKAAHPELAALLGAVEDMIEARICEALSVDQETLHGPAVKAYDVAILRDEAADLLGPSPRSWGLVLPPLCVPVGWMDRATAANEWLSAYRRLALSSAARPIPAAPDNIGEK